MPISLRVKIDSLQPGFFLGLFVVERVERRAYYSAIYLSHRLQVSNNYLLLQRNLDDFEFKITPTNFGDIVHRKPFIGNNEAKTPRVFYNHRGRKPAKMLNLSHPGGRVSTMTWRNHITYRLLTHSRVQSSPLISGNL